MSESNEDGAAAETPRQPCGCVCCRAEPISRTATAEPRVHLKPEERSNYSAEVLERFDTDCAAADKRLYWHEASHCVVAASHGRQIEHVQAAVQGQSHVSY
jgi:hypothetical protein